MSSAVYFLSPREERLTLKCLSNSLVQYLTREVLSPMTWAASPML